MDARKVRKGFYLETLGATDNKQEALSAIVSKYLGNVGGYNLDSITLDGVNDEPISLTDIIAGTIYMAHNESGLDITADSIDSAIITTQKVLDSLDVDLDSATPEARGIVAQIVGLNIYTSINAQLPFTGNVSDFVGDKNTGKFKLYSVESEAQKDAGEIKKGESLVGANAGKRFAFLTRDEEMKYVAGTTTYTFNLKNVAKDANNYPMEKGRNSVTIGSVFVDDYEADSKAKKTTRNAVVVKEDGTEVDVTVTFDYEAGTIKAEFTADIDADTPLYFEAALDTSDIDKVAGALNVDIVDENYIAQKVAIDVKANAFDIREALQVAGININATGLRFALNKVESERGALEIAKVRSLAKPFGGVINIKTAQEQTIADRYKHIVKAVANAGADILEKSLIAGNLAVVGGSAVVDIVNALGTSRVDVDRLKQTNSQNGLRELDTLYGVRYYFDPTHDEKYPLDGANNDEHTLLVVGVANDQLKRAVIGGVGMPILPEQPINEISGTKTTRLLGSVVVSPNRNERARNQARKLKVIL